MLPPSPTHLSSSRCGQIVEKIGNYAQKLIQSEQDGLIEVIVPKKNWEGSIITSIPFIQIPNPEFIRRLNKGIESSPSPLTSPNLE